MSKALPSLDGTKEATLVKMARGGNKNAFGELMVRWEPYIKASIRRIISNPDDVDEGYQEIAMSIMKTIQKMKHNNFQGWVRIAIRNRRYRFTQQLITGPRRNNLNYDPTQDAWCDEGWLSISKESEPRKACEVLEIQRDVMSAIEKLPKKQREAALGVFINEKARKEVAEDCSVSRPAIDFRINDATKALRGSLSQHAPSHKQ